MTIESCIVVRLPGTKRIRDLCADLDSAARRARKALPGDRVDVVRFEALASQLEQLAVSQLLDAGSEAVPAPVSDRPGSTVLLTEEDAVLFDAQVAARLRGWFDAGDVAIELRDAFGVGQTHYSTELADELAPPAERYEPEEGESGRQAVALRFQQQLTRIIEGNSVAAIMPSGVSNTVLTESLRTYVLGERSSQIDASVIYRDGSKGQSFPLRCLQLAPTVSAVGRTLRFALLSIRHTEMDVEVDGAWLRNTDVSRVRPAGETDDLVYELTRRQLTTILDPQGSTLIYLYQTGLETAIIGFYRAIAQQLLEQPGSVSVVPMYFRRQASNRSRVVGGSTQESHFAEGTPWTM